MQQSGVPLNAKHVIGCCKKVSGEINDLHDIVVNTLFNNILVQRWLIANEPKLDDRTTMRTPHDEITVGTEHLIPMRGRLKGALLARS